MAGNRILRFRCQRPNTLRHHFLPRLLPAHDRIPNTRAYILRNHFQRNNGIHDHPSNYRLPHLGGRMTIRRVLRPNRTILNRRGNRTRLLRYNSRVIRLPSNPNVRVTNKFIRRRRLQAGRANHHGNRPLLFTTKSLRRATVRRDFRVRLYRRFLCSLASNYKQRPTIFAKRNRFYYNIRVRVLHFKILGRTTRR